MMGPSRTKGTRSGASTSHVIITILNSQPTLTQIGGLSALVYSDRIGSHRRHVTPAPLKKSSSAAVKSDLSSHKFPNHTRFVRHFQTGRLGFLHYLRQYTTCQTPRATRDIHLGHTPGYLTESSFSET
ncbi:hypothetical protein CGRA01v4_11499 [Colletotrichum graminicola]|nr:hypothetical protein CGRA01v4_11499 [Colletotrichum graminicola]